MDIFHSVSGLSTIHIQLNAFRDVLVKKYCFNHYQFLVQCEVANCRKCESDDWSKCADGMCENGYLRQDDGSCLSKILLRYKLNPTYLLLL